MSVRKREVNRDTELDLTSTKDIVKKRMPLVKCNISKPDSLILFLSLQSELKISIAQICDQAAHIA